MGYFRSVGGSSGGGGAGFPSELNLYPFKSYQLNNMSSNNSISEGYDIPLEIFEKLKRIEINGRLLARGSNGSLKVDVFCTIQGVLGSSYYIYYINSDQWAANGWYEHQASVGLDLVTSLDTGGMGLKYIDIAKTIDIELCRQKAEELGLSFNLADFTSKYITYYQDQTSSQNSKNVKILTPISISCCIKNTYSGSQSVACAWSVDKTRTNCAFYEEEDSLATILANPPQVKLIF